MFTVSSLRANPRWPRRWVPLLALCAAGLNAHAQQALSLDQALRLAQDRSRQLVAQDAAASAAREMALAAGQLPDPTLTAGLNSLPVNGSDRFSLTADSFTMLTVGVTQEFTRKDKRQARSARFEREADAAEAGRAAALAGLRRDTAIAWLARHYQERVLELLRAQRAEAALQVEAAEAAYRGGRGAQADVFGARSAVAQADDRIRQAETQVALAKTRLARWVGASAESALAAPPAMADLGEAAGLETRLAHHPQVALLQKQEEVAQAEAEIAKSNKHADWSVDLSYSQRGSAYSNFVSLSVSIPLQWDQANRQDREVAAKLALAEQFRAQREEATREHAADVRAWQQQWQSGRERLALYDSALIPLAGERTRAAIAAYRGGGGPLAGVLDARRMEIETRLDKLRLELETASLWAQLEYLVAPDREAAAAVKEQ